MKSGLKKYFGTDGIRGRVNSSEMNASIALKLGMAAGHFFTRGEHRHHVLIGKDTRLSGYTIEPALVSGFLSMGMNVYLAGPLPTPGISALVTSMRCDIGVMISASHNSYEDNGIKIFGPDGTKLTDDSELLIEKLMDQNLDEMTVDSTKLGRAQRIEDAGGRYIEYIKSTFSDNLRLDGIKVVIDCANGASYRVAQKLLWELGAEVIPINIEPDGTNVNKNCGSTFPKEMSRAVIKNKADLGISLDGDADRCIIASEKGEIINGDKIIAIVASTWKKFGKLNKNTVVGTSFSNQGLENYLNNNNINFIRTPVGDRYILDCMKKNNFCLGGEPSGHIILGNQATGDGLRASIEILSLMKSTDNKLSKMANLFKPLPQVVKSVELKENLNPNAILKTLEKDTNILKIKSSNQVRIIFRLSGTENKLRVMIEANNNKLINNAMNEALKAINKTIFTNS